MGTWGRGAGGRLDYRADLDGLRAVAVVAVLLFHLDSPLVPGGFVGVDVFFVLSGFFIARQIASECADGRFSILSFYDRRIRRLFPALFVMLCVTTALAFLLLLPDDLARFGESLKATALSLSNFYFWKQSDYFAPAADTMPLLHTWSLAVEEQFYLVLPLLFVIIWRLWRSHLRLILAIVALVSFALSVWGAHAYPETAFYLLPFRAWELLFGCLIALMPDRAPRQWWIRNLSALAGVVGIGSAIAFYDEAMAFPGYAAALPCVGTALVIWSGQPFSASDGARHSISPIALRALALPPMVFVGLISYSLYLWHWPLIVLSRYAAVDELNRENSVWLVILCFCAAALSWRFVEQPLRRGDIVWRRRLQRFSYVGIASVAMLVLGVSIGREQGFSSLNSPGLIAVLEEAKDYSPLRKECHAGPSRQAKWSLEDTCVFGAPSDRNVVVFGDSHAAEISFALSEAANLNGLRIRQVTASSCPPALGVSPNYRPGCERFVEQIMHDLSDEPRATFVINAFYASWASQTYSESFWNGLERVVSTIRDKGHHVIILGALPPHPAGSLPHTLAKQVKYGLDPKDYSFPIDRALMDGIDRRLRALSAAHSATYVPLMRFVCGGTEMCQAEMNGHAIYFDRHHLSATTARRVVSSLILPALSVVAQR